MNFQQLRYVREAVRRHFNLTEAAAALNTSQSGVSKQIRELELELGVEIFIRRGKRFTGLTGAGQGVVALIDQVLLGSENLQRYAARFSNEHRGALVVATTHNQARYTLPDVVERFSREYPSVRLELRQAGPRQVAQSVLDGEADIGIATEALADFTDLSTFSCFTWRHVVIAPFGHPLTKVQEVSIKDVAAWPVITYGPDISGRSHIDDAFLRASLSPDIRLTAMDADVIKLYVARGLGIGIVSELALDEKDDVVAIDSGDLFTPLVAKLSLRRGSLLHDYAYRFIELFAPHLRSDVVQRVSMDRVSLRGTSMSERTLLEAAPDYALLGRAQEL